MIKINKLLPVLSVFSLCIYSPAGFAGRPIHKLQKRKLASAELKLIDCFKENGQPALSLIRDQSRIPSQIVVQDVRDPDAPNAFDITAVDVEAAAAFSRSTVRANPNARTIKSLAYRGTGFKLIVHLDRTSVGVGERYSAEVGKDHLSCGFLVGLDQVTVVGGKSAQVLTVGDLHVVSKIPVPGSPDWMGVGFGSLWAPMDGQLIRIDPATDQIIANIAIGTGSYRGVGIGYDSVWITNCGDRTISQVDAKTNHVVRTIPVSIDGTSEGSIGVGEGGIWIVTYDEARSSSQLTQLDPKSGAILAQTLIPPGSGVVADYGSVWVTHPSSGTVSRIDPKTHKIVATLNVNSGPRFIASGEGAIWVLNQGDGTVSKIDPKSNIVLNIEANTPGFGGDIAVGQGAVWVSIGGVPVTRIDPSTNSVTERFEGDAGGDALRAGLGYLWFSEGSGRIWKITP